MILRREISAGGGGGGGGGAEFFEDLRDYTSNGQGRPVGSTPLGIFSTPR